MLGLLASDAEAAEPTPAVEPAPEGRYPSLRLGLSGSLGGLAAPDGPFVSMPDGRQIALYSAGPGVDLRLGVGLTDWLALDLELFGETLLLAGDARAGALLELAPSEHFAIAAGGGVGSMYLANFFFPSPSADFGAVVVRLEGRVEEESSAESRLDLVFGAEGDLGFVFAGSLPPGAWLLGGRAFAGMLWH